MVSQNKPIWVFIPKHIVVELKDQNHWRFDTYLTTVTLTFCRTLSILTLDSCIDFRTNLQALM